MGQGTLVDLRRLRSSASNHAAVQSRARNLERETTKTGSSALASVSGGRKATSRRAAATPTTALPLLGDGSLQVDHRLPEPTPLPVLRLLRGSICRANSPADWDEPRTRTFTGRWLSVQNTTRTQRGHVTLRGPKNQGMPCHATVPVQLLLHGASLRCPLVQQTATCGFNLPTAHNSTFLPPLRRDRRVSPRILLSDCSDG